MQVKQYGIGVDRYGIGVDRYGIGVDRVRPGHRYAGLQCQAMCQKRPIMCKKKPIMCQKRPIRYIGIQSGTKM